MSTITPVRVPESLQPLIDSRLDTIERMLLGRLPRSERLEIVREVETQIFELLQQRGADEPTREDVLAVLARLDPPEAYLPEEGEIDRGGYIPRAAAPRPAAPPGPAPRGEFDSGKISGIVGIVALGLLILVPVIYLLVLMTNSELVLILAAAGMAGFMFLGGIVAIALAIHARFRGPMALVGVITGAFSLLVSSVAGLWLLIAILS
jgi:hypothetical protein